MTQHIDVTDKVSIGGYDEEIVSLTKCVCGATFHLWGWDDGFLVSIYPESPYECPKCGRKITRQSSEEIAGKILEFPRNSKVMLLAPRIRGRKGEYKDLFDRLRKDGFLRARVDGKLINLEDEKTALHKNKKQK